MSEQNMEAGAGAGAAAEAAVSDATNPVTGQKWVVEEMPDGFRCVFEEHMADGTSKAVSGTDVYESCLTGRDVALISAVCGRFKFAIEEFTEMCRRSDSRAIAMAQCQRLNNALAGNGRK